MPQLMTGTCLTCGRELVFRPGKGWRHGREPEASCYWQRCVDCGWEGSTTARNCPGCGKHTLRDDHCARPDATKPGGVIEVER